jgi:hypothetical protein
VFMNQPAYPTQNPTNPTLLCVEQGTKIKHAKTNIGDKQTDKKRATFGGRMRSAAQKLAAAHAVTQERRAMRAASANGAFVFSLAPPREPRSVHDPATFKRGSCFSRAHCLPICCAVEHTPGQGQPNPISTKTTHPPTWSINCFQVDGRTRLNQECKKMRDALCAHFFIASLYNCLPRGINYAAADTLLFLCSPRESERPAEHLSALLPLVRKQIVRN